MYKRKRGTIEMTVPRWRLRKCARARSSGFDAGLPDREANSSHLPRSGDFLAVEEAFGVRGRCRCLLCRLLSLGFFETDLQCRALAQVIGGEDLDPDFAGTFVTSGLHLGTSQPFDFDSTALFDRVEQGAGLVAAHFEPVFERDQRFVGECDPTRLLVLRLARTHSDPLCFLIEEEVVDRNGEQFRELEAAVIEEIENQPVAQALRTLVELTRDEQGSKLAVGDNAFATARDRLFGDFTRFHSSSLK